MRPAANGRQQAATAAASFAAAPSGTSTRIACQLASTPGRQHRLAAAGDGDVDPAGADRPHRLADRHRRGGAGAGIGERGAAGAEVQGDLGDRRVRHGRDDAGRPHPPAVGEDGAAGRLEGRRPGHAAAPEDAEPLRIEAAGLEARGPGGVARRRQGHRRRPVERQARRRRHRRGIEIGARHRHRRQLDAGQVERLCPHRRATGEERRIEGRERVADRAHHAGTGQGDGRARARARRLRHRSPAWPRPPRRSGPRAARA